MGSVAVPKSQPGEELENEIALLEQRLAEAKAKRSQSTPPPHSSSSSPPPALSKPLPSTLTSPTHFLLLLSDSALPLGSFAFSSGLESYLAHQKSVFGRPASFAPSFLPLSISSYASATLPFVLAAHRDPSFAKLAALDDALDAAVVCTVGKRASVAQGRALLGIWERSFVGALGKGHGESSGEAALREFAAQLRASSIPSGPTTNGNTTPSTTATIAGNGVDDINEDPDAPPPIAAHLPPLFGAIGALAGLSAEQTAYVFLLGHVKALVSAAVRAGMFGPYQAQKTLASEAVQGLIAAMVEREWTRPIEEAGQSAPVMDLWMGRHETLYSRIFNS